MPAPRFTLGSALAPRRTATAALAAMALCCGCRAESRLGGEQERKPLSQHATWTPCLQAPLRRSKAPTKPERGPVELTVAAAYWVESPGFEGLEPSGLATRGDDLLTVSDNHDTIVFSASCHGTTAKVTPYVRFEAPPSGALAAVRGLDWEAIAVRDSGQLLLASETASRVVEVDPKSGRAVWISPSLEPMVAPQGLLVGHNAKIEGLTTLPSGALLLAAERDERGLIEVWRGEVRGWPMGAPPLALPGQRRADFSALARDGEDVFAVLRAASAVVKLARQADGGWSETVMWTFGATENAPTNAYLDATFGQAEGLTLTPTHVWIMFDNNGQGRRQVPADKRPLLVAFHRP